MGRVEVWKSVLGHPSYEVSDRGQVKRVGRAKGATVGSMLHPYANTKHYLTVTLCSEGAQTRHYVHHLVLQSFVGECPSLGHQCNHIDSNKSNNNLSNLEWVTPSENLLHAYRAGTKKATRSEDTE